MFYLVEWPYHDCKIFSYGDTVIYRQTEDELLFYHPGKHSWQRASRRCILSEARILKKTAAIEDLDVSL